MMTYSGKYGSVSQERLGDGFYPAYVDAI
jgi:hypothetical protein